MKDEKYFLKKWKVKDYFEVGKKYKKTFETLIENCNCGKYIGYWIDNCLYDELSEPKVMLIGTTSYLMLMMVNDKILCVAQEMIFKYINKRITKEDYNKISDDISFALKCDPSKHNLFSIFIHEISSLREKNNIDYEEYQRLLNKFHLFINYLETNNYFKRSNNNA